ncbi:hypothetical protein [Salinarimonas sp.]|uniref:hypothetical protein n=1 Tax=Salinarimonas sp. TaxID=2766526 RepID=UPI00391C7C90
MNIFKNNRRAKTSRRSRGLVLVIDRNALVVGAALTFATALIVRQMEGHREAMEAGLLAEALNVQRGNRLLAVFEAAASRDAVRERLRAQQAFAAFAPLFLFAVLDDVRADFGGCWSDLAGQPVAL